MNNEQAVRTECWRENSFCSRDGGRNIVRVTGSGSCDFFNDVQHVDIFLTFPIHPVTPASPLVSILLHSTTCHTHRGLSNLRDNKKRVSINIAQILHGVVHSNSNQSVFLTFEADESSFSAPGGGPVCPQGGPVK